MHLRPASLLCVRPADDGVDEYRTASSAFADGIAAGAVIQPGQKLQIDDYSMRVDGDFISARRVILVVNGERSEYFVSISKLAGYLTCEHLHGLHELKSVQSVQGEKSATFDYRSAVSGEVFRVRSASYIDGHAQWLPRKAGIFATV